jgi:hypothetical protein
MIDLDVRRHFFAGDRTGWISNAAGRDGTEKTSSRRSLVGDVGEIDQFGEYDGDVGPKLNQFRLSQNKRNKWIKYYMMDLSQNNKVILNLVFLQLLNNLDLLYYITKKY